MQVVGSKCKVCGERIGVQTEGASCPDCRIVFHRRCAVEGMDCPECKEDFEELLLRAREEEQAELQWKETRGRGLVLACALILLAPSLLALAALVILSLGDPEFPFPMAIVPPFLISCVVAVSLYLRVHWARVWALILLAFGAVGTLAQAVDALHEDLLLAILSFGFAVLYAGTFTVLAASKSVSYVFLRRG